MRGFPRCLLVVLAIALTSTAGAGADTFTATLVPVNGGVSLGGYGCMWNASLPFDFGFGFSSINSISLHWVADVCGGQQMMQIWFPDEYGGHYEYPYWPVDGEMIITAGSAVYGDAIPLGPNQTYDVDRVGSPSVQEWDLTSGHSTVDVEVYAQGYPGGVYSPAPSAYLSLLTVTVDGTAVPEPSTALALASGLPFLVWAARRRKN